MRRRILAVTIAAAALVAVAFAIPLGVLVRNVANDRAINAAERDAAALAPALAVTSDPDLLEGAIERTDTGTQQRLSIIEPDDTLIGDPTPPDPTTVELVRRDQTSLTITNARGLALYTPVVTGNGELSIIRATIPDDQLDAGVTRAWTALGSVAVVLIAGSAFVADRLARSLTRDAHHLAATADLLASGDPTARAPSSDVAEIDTAGRALNQLADRIDQLRAAERERIADLSHRLRTPLTALRLDADTNGDPAILDDVTRLETAVTDLIHTARRPLHDSPVAPTCDAVAITRQRAEFWGALADDDNRPWTLTTPDTPVTIACSAHDLGDALDAVLDNVFAHTPPATPYQLAVTVDHDATRIIITDDGPGISTDDPTRRGTTTTGTGLGLDIARRVATAAGGTLTIDSTPGAGTTATIELPAVT